MHKLLATAILTAFALIQAPALAQDKPVEKKEATKPEAMKAEPAKPEAKKAEAAKGDAMKAEPAKADAKATTAKKDEPKKPKKGGC